MAGLMALSVVWPNLTGAVQVKWGPDVVALREDATLMQKVLSTPEGPRSAANIISSIERATPGDEPATPA